uniref:DUF2514 family protein n=1 Tax=Variovorax paradoxus (strain S110) TaxID=543728 RepID=C5CJR8_VARPS
MSLFGKLIPWWVQPLIIATLLMGLLGQRVQVSNAKANVARAKVEFANYKIDQQELRILADRARSLRAEARQTAVNKEARDGQERIAAVEAERDAARVAGERMRSAYLAAAERARALSRTPAVGKGEPDSDPIGVFAVLLGRADSREEIVRGYADRLRAVGTICERGWDAGLRVAPRPAAP